MSPLFIIIWPCILIIMLTTRLLSGHVVICARARILQPRPKINNMPSKSHVIPFLLHIMHQYKKTINHQFSNIFAMYPYNSKPLLPKVIQLFKRESRMFNKINLENEFLSITLCVEFKPSNLFWSLNFLRAARRNCVAVPDPNSFIAIVSIKSRDWHCNANTLHFNDQNSK